MTLRIFIGIAVLAVLGTGAWIALEWCAHDIRRQGRNESPQPSDAAIILGAYTDGFRPGAALSSRLRAALHLYRHGIVSYLIVSGGQGDDETVTESRSMKRFLVLNGVAPELILEDRRSTDTWENLVNSQCVMEKHGFQTAVIVTSDYHLPRALAVAKQLNIKVTGYAAWSSRRDFRYARREVIARIQYTMNGRVSLRWKGR